MTTKARTNRVNRHLRGRGKIARTRAALAGAASEMRERITTVPTTMTGFAKRNPLKTVGFSVLAGVAIAQLLRLRHK